jgi:predicted ATPase
MHGFPAALTSFIGRADVVNEIAGQLSQDRLVTLTGPGGAGKTRLAGEVARHQGGQFADGVWLAELAAVRDPAQVAAAVAAALGIWMRRPVAFFAVRGFTEALIEDLRAHAPHVRAAVVLPGHVGTDIIRNSLRPAACPTPCR